MEALKSELWGNDKAVREVGMCCGIICFRFVIDRR